MFHRIHHRHCYDINLSSRKLAEHLGQLRAALSWAVKMGFLPKIPQIHKPKRAKGQKMMRGRPPSGEEFDRILDAVPKTRPHDAAAWIHYLNGLWLSGLRLEESMALSWDPDSPFAVDLTGKHPRFRIYAEAEKGHQDRLIPITPDFAQYLLQTRENDRMGPVFRLPGRLTGEPLSPKRISRIVSAIGKKANVVVNRTTKKVKTEIDGRPRLVEQEVVKYASAHDLRRAFGTRWAPKVMPAVLQRLMRHSAIETTLRYYVALDTDRLADQLWRDHGSIDTSVNSCPKRAPHSEHSASGETKEPLAE